MRGVSSPPDTSHGKCPRLSSDEACTSKMPHFALNFPLTAMELVLQSSPRSPIAGGLPALGANPDCSCLCFLPQMANPVPSACCVVLAAVVVVYAQRHSQQGESSTPPRPWGS